MERGNRMRKVLFGITSLTLGGAERVLVDIANNLCGKYDITIFTIYAKGELEKQLNPKVKLKTLYPIAFSELSTFQQKIGVPLKILLRKNSIYRKYIKGNYEVEVAFLEGPITRLFSSKNKKVKKFVWIHNDISLVFGTGIKAKIKKRLDKKIYDKYQELIFVSQDNLDKFNEVYPNEKIENRKVIYNYIDKKNILEKAKEEKEIAFSETIPNFVIVARLVPQKAIDRLICIHSKLVNHGLKHNFYVVGEGPERRKLEGMIEKYKVGNSFFLLGKKENPYPYIKSSDYFCLLSKFEGYGMVLEEAKILNRPIIITNTAAREAVRDYENATILENTDIGIYQGLKEIIEKSKEEKRQEEIKYDNSNILEKIIELVGE